MTRPTAMYLRALAWTVLVVCLPPVGIAIGFACGDWRYGRLRDLA
jgi:hypothetical protein